MKDSELFALTEKLKRLNNELSECCKVITSNVNFFNEHTIYTANIFNSINMHRYHSDFFINSINRNIINRKEK